MPIGRSLMSKGDEGMLSQNIFRIDMVLGYLAWALCLGTYVWPGLRTTEHAAAHRAIATFNSFRFFGLVFLLPGVVGSNLPAAFAGPSAYGDLATALLAILALLFVRVRSAFWPLVWAFNLVGLADLVMDTANAWRLHLPAMAGEFGTAYAIVILYVPALFLMHLFSFWLLLRPVAATIRSAGAPVSLTATER
jgi:hypothetical protein